VEAEEGLALVVKRRLGRVEVLRLLVAEGAGAKTQRAPAVVGERKDDAVTEAVVDAAAAAGDDEAGVEEFLRAEALADGGVAQLLPAGGRIAHAEAPADVGAETARVEVGARRGAAFALPKPTLIVDGRALEQVAETLAAPPLGLASGAGLFVLECDAVLVGEVFDRLGEIEPLLALHEGEQVAALAAAEAVVDLLDRVDRERRRLLFVERAAAHEVGARLLELRVVTDDLDEVGSRPYLVDALAGDARHGQLRCATGDMVNRRPAARRTDSRVPPTWRLWARRHVRAMRRRAGTVRRRVSGAPAARPQAAPPALARTASSPPAAAARFATAAARRRAACTCSPGGRAPPPGRRRRPASRPGRRG